MSEVMIRFKKTYTSINKINDKLSINFSDICKDDTYKANAFIDENGEESDYMYISPYFASKGDDDKLHSSNESTPYESDLDLIRTKLNEGYNALSYDKYMYLYTLLLLITKSYDVNNTIGTGTSVNKNGLLNEKGMFYGSTDGNLGNKVFGIENLWSDKWTILEGVLQKNNDLYKLVNGDYSNTDLYEKVNTENINFDKGYISKLTGNTDYLLPSESLGSSSTYTTAYNGLNENTNGNTNILVGGSNNNISNIFNIKSENRSGCARITFNKAKEV